MSSQDNRAATDLPQVPMEHLDDLWFQVAGTLCNLTCHHCFISCSPKNDSFGFLSLADVRRSLEESVPLGVKEYYFTGGEPFLNPAMVDILLATLHYGPATVLTNATVLRDEWLVRLAEGEQASDYALEFRVSLDGFSPETNDPIRGDGTFERARQGLRKLVAHGFLPIITAARTWDLADEPQVVGSFGDMLKEIGYTRPRIKILPTLQLGAEELRTRGYLPGERVTREMLEEYDASQLLCSRSRIVTDRGVHVCPILIDAPESRMGSHLSDTLAPFAITHGACYTCYQYGAICSNSTASRSGGTG
jgi:AdoMet-dependent heme synthase